MNQEQKKRPGPKKRKRGPAVAAVLCFVAAIAIVGTYTFKDYKQAQKEQLQAKMEQEKKEAGTDKIVNEPEKSAEEKGEGNTPLDNVPNTEESDENNGNSGSEEQNTDNENDGNATDGTTDEGAQTQTTGSRAVSGFDGKSELLWPVDGSILMNYSMDKTVYFKTLDQYKYNPAVIFSAAVGDQVIAATTGVVKSIDKTAQTGTTVTVDIGNGYELIYGQLKEVPVKTGQQVAAKTTLGYVSEPTKYYSAEGSNVYFEMRKNGQPVNPIEFLVE